MNEEDKVLAWTIDSPAVYDKLVRTTLRYTPVIIEHHAPYKTLPNGRLCVLCRPLMLHKNSHLPKQSPNADTKTKDATETHHFIFSQRHSYYRTTLRPRTVEDGSHGEYEDPSLRD